MNCGNVKCLVRKNSCITWSSQDLSGIAAENTIGSLADYRLAKSESYYTFKQVQVAISNTRFLVSATYEAFFATYQYNSPSRLFFMIGNFPVTAFTNVSDKNSMLQVKVKDCM